MVVFSYNNIKREIKLPKKNNKILAEFLGILTGDGYIGQYKYNYVIEIAGNKIKDRDYLENYVFNLFKQLFNIEPNLIFRNYEKTMYLRVYSKAILGFLKNKEFKQGRKGRIRTPKWIKHNRNFMILFVKGFFDTDGSIALKKKEGKLYPSISISSKSDLLLMEFKSFLLSEGISSYFATIKHKGARYKNPFETYQLQINGYKKISLWFDKIGSSNPRNISRFKEMVRLRELKKL